MHHRGREARELGATTVEAPLMGVPVVTLLGQRVAGRLSASFLTALGLEDLVAQTPDAYAEIAGHLAGDLNRLAAERATLRERLLASPVGDTRAVEAAYRDLWRAWTRNQETGVRRNDRQACQRLAPTMMTPTW